MATERFLGERGCPRRADRVGRVSGNLADVLAAYPAHSAEEAIAAALMIYTDLDGAMGGATDFIRDAARLRIEQRVVGLAAWIEGAHGIDRRDWGLDYFGDHNLVGTARLMPHAEANLSAESDG